MGQWECAEWDDASTHRPQTGPGGTAWDSHYRSFIQTDASAVSKGLPTHAESARAILADAVKSPQNQLQHRGWVLFIKHFSSRLTSFVVLSGPMDLTRVRPTELARQPLRGQDFANAFTAAFGCTAEQFEQDPDVRERLHKASPLFLVTDDDPPGFVMGTWGEDLAAAESAGANRDQ